jgi:luciferase family oxidoreductase group 1
MKSRKHIPLSVLSLAAISSEGTVSSALKNVVEIAQAVEKFGYKRFWLAEHHNIPGVASSTTPVLIGHVAQQTSSLRVGSGGIMLPNHAPLIVAENFGTLGTLYPGRIDLGLGRAPGTDPLTARALRRDLKSTSIDFPELIEEVQAFLAPSVPGQTIRAIPGAGVEVPIWILGSSLFSADLAARMGLPYSFAAHFAPTELMDALEIYRTRFVPSSSLEKPYAMICLPVIAAATDEEARYLATSTQQKILGLISRRYPSSSPAPVDSMDGIWNEPQREAVNSFLKELIVGGPETVRLKLEAFVERTQADELMIHTDMYRKEDVIRSFEIVSQVWGMTAKA